MTEESLLVLVSGLKAWGAAVVDVQNSGQNVFSVICFFIYCLFFVLYTRHPAERRSEERERPCSESVCTGTAPFAHRWDSNGNSNKSWHIWTLVAFNSLQLHWGQMAWTHPGSVLLLWWGKKTKKNKERDRETSCTVCFRWNIIIHEDENWNDISFHLCVFWGWLFFMTD